MRDLDAFLAEAFGVSSSWGSAQFLVAAQACRDRKAEQVAAWCRRNAHTPSRVRSVRQARERYAQAHPERVRASQARYARVKWSRTQADPDKLERRRAYQRAWCKQSRTKSNKEASCIIPSDH